jgi:hypothetical protein
MFIQPDPLPTKILSPWRYWVGSISLNYGLYMRGLKWFIQSFYPLPHILYHRTYNQFKLGLIVSFSNQSCIQISIAFKYVQCCITPLSNTHLIMFPFPYVFIARLIGFPGHICILADKAFYLQV